MRFKTLELADYNLVAPRSRNSLFARAARLPRARELVFGAPDAWRMAMCDWNDWPVAIGGLFPIWPGRAEAWLLLGPEIGLRETLAALTFCRVHMDMLQARDPDCHRIEMWVEADAPWCARFAERLGMRQEGLAKAWGPDGADHMLFARVADAVAQRRAA